MKHGLNIWWKLAFVSATLDVLTLPRNCRLAKSACFVLGWALVVGGVLAAAVTCGDDITIWNRLQETLPHETGKVLSESSASDLWVACQIAKTTSVTCLLSALAAALGAVLIQISQRLRWRMADEQDRQRVMESMQQSTGEYGCKRASVRPVAGQRPPIRCD
jgi:hypothetical protein